MGLIADLALIIIAAIASIGAGLLWYGPLFGKRWRHLTKQQKTSATTYPLLILSSIIQAAAAYTAAIFFGTVTVLDGALVGAFLWLGFVATTQINSVLWEKQKPELYILNNAYYLVSLVLMSVIFSIP